VKSLYPLGQPKKALGPRASDRSMCCQPGNRPAYQLREIDRRRRYSVKMKLRWNHARPAPGPEERKPERNGSHNEQGLEVKNAHSPSGRGRKMSLTFPLIDQAISRIDPTKASLSAHHGNRFWATCCCYLLLWTETGVFSGSVAHTFVPEPLDSMTKSP